MTALDACIGSVFEPGNPGLATDSGAITTPHYSGFFLLEEAADHFLVEEGGAAIGKLKME